ncbi:MAG: hypothetical protein U0905_01615 [Pirellulales bacterium]
MNHKPEQHIAWDICTRGLLTLEAIQSIHVPNGNFRISKHTYPAATRFSGAARAAIVYLLNGCCRFEFAAGIWQLTAPCFAEMPEGRYNFEVGHEAGVDLVEVWELPVGFRRCDTSFEQIDPSKSRVGRDFES